MQDVTKLCAGRAEELLLKLDGALDRAADEQLEQHVADCRVCQQLMASLRALDTALVSRFAAEPLTGAFDRAVLARLAALPLLDPESAMNAKARLALERAEALAELRTSVRRGLGTGLLALTGIGAILLAGGHLAPRLLDFVGRHGTALPTAGPVLTALAVVGLALAAAYLVSRVQGPAMAA